MQGTNGNETKAIEGVAEGKTMTVGELKKYLDDVDDKVEFSMMVKNNDGSKTIFPTSKCVVMIINGITSSVYVES